MTSNLGTGTIVSGGSTSKAVGKSFITRKSVLGLSNQQMSIVKNTGAVEEIDEDDLVGSNSGEDGEHLIDEAFEDLEQLDRDLGSSDGST